MGDLISRQAAIEAVNHICPVDTEYDCTLLDRVDVRCVLLDLPSAERKKGRWELAEDGWYCSSCELYPPFDCDPEEKGIPFCPWCGAEMVNSDEL